MTRKHLSLAGVLFAALIAPSVGLAYNFIPTEAEFRTWPMYCQARYASLDIGKQQPFSVRFPKSLMDTARHQLGDHTFERVHHWCTGVIWLNRAKLEPDPKVRAFDLHEARNEANFTLVSLEGEGPLIGQILTTLALISREEKDYEGAADLLEEAIKVRPQDPGPYSALAMVQRSRKRLDLARDALQRGNEAMQGQSAEIHYNLGLILVETKDYDAALEQAHLAYEMGFPLPGLKNKLVALKKWAEPPAAQTVAEPQPAVRSN
jgi:tetratricopeptide (TPR) repeat protein